jgi:4-amino-4-deoxy-L-arabinose transferase-like glycosyltransferase
MCGFFFFYGLDAGEMYRTEGLRAIIAGEFLRSGNWVVPTLYGEPLFTKPPGMYAAIALASWPGDVVTEWSARLPSAVAATVTVLLIYLYFRRQLGQLGGLVIAAVLPLSLMWLDKATAAEIDMMQVAWVTAGLLCFLRALEIEEDQKVPRAWGVEREAWGVGRGATALNAPRSTLHASRIFWWLGALLCVAGGVLTKWTAPAFFYGTVIPLLWWRGQLRLLFRREHLISALLGASLCCGWAALAINLGGWDKFSFTVSREALMHLSPGHHHRAYPWLESLVHPFRVWAACLPVSLFALPTLWPGFSALWDQRGRRLLQVLHCWTWPNLMFWSLIPEHGTRQSFPLFPGLAGLAGMVWLAWLTGRLAWPWPRIPPTRVLVAMMMIWLIVKLAFVHGVVPERNRNREPRAKAAALAAVVPEGRVLYLFRLKDEGIMFYYGRTVRRLASPAHLPSSGEPLYCILEKSEWEQYAGRAESILRLEDEQGAPIVLARVAGKV